MPENVNWFAVLQSVTDTWLPLIIAVGVLAIGLFIFAICRKKKNK